MTDYLVHPLNWYQRVYATATGSDSTLKHVATLRVEEYQALAVASVPVANGPHIECEWCGHTCPDVVICNHNNGVIVKTHNAATHKYATPAQIWFGSR